MPATTQSLHALKAIMKAVQARGQGGLETEMMLMNVRSLLGVDDAQYFDILEDLKGDAELAFLTGQPAAKKPRLSEPARPKQPQAARARPSAEGMPPPPPRSAPRPRPRPRQRAEALVGESSGELDGVSTPRGGGRRGGPPPMTAPPALGQPGRVQAGLGLIGMRVLRNWPEEGGWHEAIVTDFDAANMTWVLTYNFGHGAGVEKWEKFNILEADPERMIVTDDKVDIKTYRSPLNLVYNAVAPAAAFEDSVFEMRLDYNSRQPRGLEGLKVELDQRRCAVSAEEEVLDLMDSLEDAGKGGAEGWKPALKERHAALCEEERRIRREMEMLVDV